MFVFGYNSSYQMILSLIVSLSGSHSNNTRDTQEHLLCQQQHYE